MLFLVQTLGGFKVAGFSGDIFNHDYKETFSSLACALFSAEEEIWDTVYHSYFEHCHLLKSLKMKYMKLVKRA